jgi:polyhydroxybutyrate depolymerase
MLRAVFTSIGVMLALAACHKGSDATSGDQAAATGGDGGTTTAHHPTTSGDDDDATGSSSGTNAGPSSGGPTIEDAGPITTVDPAKVVISDQQVTLSGTTDTRAYVLAVPTGVTVQQSATPAAPTAAKKYPLIIALHGDGQNAHMFVDYSKILPVTGDQAIVAYPDQVLDLFTPYGSNHDQRLVRAAILDVEAKTGAVDTTKIWGFGYSKGAFMLNELACRKPGLFNAMAAHAGGAPQEQNADGSVNCPTAQAIPFFITEGANDDPAGGKFEADYWRGLAGCGDTLSAASVDPQICQAFGNCKDPVDYCQIPNHGHAPLYDGAAPDSWSFFNALAQ